MNATQTLEVIYNDIVYLYKIKLKFTRIL